MLFATCFDRISKKVDKSVEPPSEEKFVNENKSEHREAEFEDTKNTSLLGSLTLEPDSLNSLELPSDEPIIPKKYKHTRDKKNIFGQENEK